MALTPSEEALVRQLLNQQAAILSLAGNEATITSKLGATKVTLADLVAASGVADADLLLMRQGTNDKSVTPALLRTYAQAGMATQLGVQVGAYNTASAGGTANALTASFTPAIAALANGLSLFVRAGSANTTTTPTFAANGLTAKTIVKGNNLPLVAGDIAGAGHWLELQFDSVLDKWVLLNPATGVVTATRPVTSAKRLDVRTSFVQPNYQYQITADEIVVKDTSGNATLLTGLTVTGDITVAGAGGLDTGFEAANQWYAIWLIYNPTTQTANSLLSISGTNPSMPSGFTQRALVSYVRNDPSANFRAFHQRGDIYQYKLPPAVLTSGTATTLTAVDIGVTVPGDAKSVFLACNKVSPAAVGQSTAIVTAGPASNTATVNVLAYSGGQAQSGFNNSELMLEWPEYQSNIYYQNAAGGSLTIFVNGFSLSGIASF